LETQFQVHLICLSHTLKSAKSLFSKNLAQFNILAFNLHSGGWTILSTLSAVPLNHWLPALRGLYAGTTGAAKEIIMRSTHALGWSLVVAVAAVSGSAHAQFKFPVNPAPKNDFQDVKNTADLKHGTLVSLKLNNDTTVIGHVVRFDAQANRLVVRTKPGEAPVAYAEEDIRQVQKAVRPAGSIVNAGFSSEVWRPLPFSNGLEENQSGVIRIKPRRGTAVKPAVLQRQDGNKIKLAIDEPNSRVQNVVQPEIITQSIYNGNQRSVVYISSVLSPAERDVLDKAQRAQNDLLALAYHMEQRDQALAHETLLQNERLRTQMLLNDTIRNENSVNYPYPPATPATAGVLTLLNLKGVILGLPQVIPPVAGVIERLPALDPQIPVRAREEWLRLQSQLVMEDGRLVAVIVK
jgi:hypothetical protein